MALYEVKEYTNGRFFIEVLVDKEEENNVYYWIAQVPSPYGFPIQTKIELEVKSVVEGFKFLETSPKATLIKMIQDTLLEAKNEQEQEEKESKIIVAGSETLEKIDNLQKQVENRRPR